MGAEPRPLGIIVPILLAFATGCGEQPLISARWHLFGTEGEARIVTDGDVEQARRALSELAALWNAFHRDWHPWEEGPLRRLNQALAEGRWSDPLPPSLLELIEAGSHIERLTGGLVAPGLGELYARFRPSAETPPTDSVGEDALAALLAAPPRLSHLERRGDRLRSHHPRLRLDLSAIAEGQALAAGADLLRRLGIRNALLVLGGEAYALGRRPDGRRWRVALRHPKEGVLATVELEDQEGLFAAGTYARFRQEGGRRLAHVVDPRTGRPLATLATAAVLHRDPVLADGAATALLVGGTEEFGRLVVTLGVGCAIYLEIGRGLFITAAMRDRLRNLTEMASATVYDAGPDCHAASDP